MTDRSTDSSGDNGGDESGDAGSPGVPALDQAERAVVDRGRTWIRDNEERLLDLLDTLVATPSVTGTEGAHDNPNAIAGAVSSFLDEHAEAATLDHQRVAEDPPRDNCYAILEGASDEVLICTSHTDTVAPGDAGDWPGDDPYGLSSGAVHRVEPGTVELSVGEYAKRRSIREAYDAVWEQREADGREVLVGRGAYDNKASIVCLAGALLAIERACAATGRDLDGTLVHGHLVGEEVSQAGAKAMVGWGDRPDWLGERYPDPEGAVVVLDGSYGYVPAVGHRGLAWLTLAAEGESTHASTPHLGRNAVLGTARGLAATEDESFRAAIEEPFQDDELLGDLTVAAGTTVVGGAVTRDGDGAIHRAGVNAVPDWCETTFDVRFPRWADYPEDVDAIREHLESTVRDHAGEHAPELSFRATVDPDEFFAPVALADSRAAAREHPLVARALAATESTVGFDPGVTVAPGVTDAAAIYPELRLPTIVEYGPAGALSHEPLEFVERESVIEGAEAMLELTVRQLGLV